MPSRPLPRHAPINKNQPKAKSKAYFFRACLTRGAATSHSIRVEPQRQVEARESFSVVQGRPQGCPEWGLRVHPPEAGHPPAPVIGNVAGFLCLAPSWKEEHK